MHDKSFRYINFCVRDGIWTVVFLFIVALFVFLYMEVKKTQRVLERVVENQVVLSSAVMKNSEAVEKLMQYKLRNTYIVFPPEFSKSAILSLFENSNGVGGK